MESSLKEVKTRDGEESFPVLSSPIPEPSLMVLRGISVMSLFAGLQVLAATHFSASPSLKLSVP
jgi:hypothetical protein